MDREDLIQKQIDLLSISYAEAAKLVDDDYIIDHGGRCDWEPSVEEEKAMRKATKLVVRKPAAANSKRTKKVDLVKVGIMQLLEDALSNSTYSSFQVINPERLISITVDGQEYKLTLSKTNQRTSV